MSKKETAKEVLTGLGIAVLAATGVALVGAVLFNVFPPVTHTYDNVTDISDEEALARAYRVQNAEESQHFTKDALDTPGAISAEEREAIDKAIDNGFTLK